MPALAPPTQAISALFGGIDADSFARHYWNRHYLHHKPGLETVDRLLGESWRMADWRGGVDRAFEWPGSLQRVYSPLGNRQLLDVVPSQIDSLVRAGRTVISDVLDPRLSAVAQRIKRDLHVPGPADTFVSFSSPGEAVSPHFDGPHVFALQIEGRKQWTLSRDRVIENPARGRNMMPDGTIDFSAGVAEGEVLDTETRTGPCDTIVLEPGDCLYLPPGTVHSTAALETSLSFMIDIAPSRFDTVIEVAFRHANPDGPWRELPPQAGGESTAEYLEHALASAAEWAAGLGLASPEFASAWNELAAEMGPFQDSYVRTLEPRA